MSITTSKLNEIQNKTTSNDQEFISNVMQDFDKMNQNNHRNDDSDGNNGLTVLSNSVYVSASISDNNNNNNNDDDDQLSDDDHISIDSSESESSLSNDSDSNETEFLNNDSDKMNLINNNNSSSDDDHDNDNIGIDINNVLKNNARQPTRDDNNSEETKENHSTDNGNSTNISNSDSNSIENTGNNLIKKNYFDKFNAKPINTSSNNILQNNNNNNNNNIIDNDNIQNDDVYDYENESENKENERKDYGWSIHPEDYKDKKNNSQDYLEGYQLSKTDLLSSIKFTRQHTTSDFLWKFFNSIQKLFCSICDVSNLSDRRKFDKITTGVLFEIRTILRVFKKPNAPILNQNENGDSHKNLDYIENNSWIGYLQCPDHTINVLKQIYSNKYDQYALCTTYILNFSKICFNNGRNFAASLLSYVSIKVLDVLEISHKSDKELLSNVLVCFNGLFNYIVLDESKEFSMLKESNIIIETMEIVQNRRDSELLSQSNNNQLNQSSSSSSSSSNDRSSNTNNKHRKKSSSRSKKNNNHNNRNRQTYSKRSTQNNMTAIDYALQPSHPIIPQNNHFNNPNPNNNGSRIPKVDGHQEASCIIQ